MKRTLRNELHVSVEMTAYEAKLIRIILFNLSEFDIGSIAKLENYNLSPVRLAEIKEAVESLCLELEVSEWDFEQAEIREEK